MDKIQPTSLVEEMSRSYLEYSLAVVIGRAIPDALDGLKPVHRRILTAMKDLNLSSAGAFKKAARVEGETMGKYHPHGSAYGSMVTMAAPHGNNHRLIDGHGNWGSEADPAASSRYTECRLAAFSEEVLLEDFYLSEKRDNYDGSLKEPVRLEARLPNSLIFGGEGIGVGYATCIPQHNLRGVVEVVKGFLAGLPPEKTAKHLIPDFPSGCIIAKDEGLREYLASGRGSVRMRAVHTISTLEREGRKADWDVLTFTNLPYQVSTEKVGEEIKLGLEDGNITDVISLRDESDRSGQRLVVFTKKGKGQDVLEQLFSRTSLDKKFPANNTVILNSKPVTLAPHEIVWEWLKWRDERVLVKFQRELEDAKASLHTKEGLLKATSILDEIISVIRLSKDPSEALSKLMKSFDFSEGQAKAILSMRLSSLSGLDIRLLKKDISSLSVKIKNLSSLIRYKKKREEYILTEVDELGKRHGNKRICEVKELSTLVTKGKEKKARVTTTKNRFIKVDVKKGVVEQQKNLKGSNLVLSNTDKLIILSEGGWVKKLPSKHSGACFSDYQSVPLFGSEEKVSQESYLAVWLKDGFVYSNCVDGSLLCKTTSKGKRWLPEGANLLYLGSGSYRLSFVSKRKKDKTISTETEKKRPLGSGSKLFKESDLLLPKDKL